jgi:formylglycine-generating enzyme required for sulfatase activity
LRSAGVALAAAGLVAAVWISLVLSESTATRRADAAGEPVPDFGQVPGFLSDAWYLPDEELLGFVEIPGGPFTMGSDPAADTAAFDLERWSPEQARGIVDVPRFFVGRYEVTVAQYAAFVAATGHRVADAEALRAPPDHPVASVAWTDAVAYGMWLGSELAASPRTPAELRALLEEGWRVGLPSEAEWEKAARGDDGRLYPWGDEPRRERANFLSRGTTPVGTFGCPECPYDLYDMAGNVWEWTRSPYQPYPYDPTDDREGLEADALWVMRGGSFADPPHFVRAANRGGADPGARRPFIGFRVVISRF